MFVLFTELRVSVSQTPFMFVKTNQLKDTNWINVN